MNYVVIDLEYNQPFAFGDGTITELVPECPFEIIQIGVVKLDEKFNIKSKINILIKPQLYKKIHPYVKEITGLDETILENSMGFTDGYKELIKFIGKTKSILCVWGNNDIKELSRNILYYNLNDVGIPKSFINVQSLTSRHFSKPNGMCIGLKNAVELLNIKIDHIFHDALNDAVYTAKILQKVQQEDMPINDFQVSQYKPIIKPIIKPNILTLGKTY